MYWILQNNIFREEAYDGLIGVLQRFELPYKEYRVVPFLGTLLPLTHEGEIDPAYSDDLLSALTGPVITMGSYSMRHAAKTYGFKPGVFDLMETGSFEYCMEHWGEHMLNGDSIVTSFEGAIWPESEERFIRPTDDSKYFAGTMMESIAFREWQHKVCVLKLDYGNSLTPETLIQVAKPKRIYTEYRCWVVKGCIVTMSLYKRGDTVVYQNMDGLLGDEARAFANQVLQIGWLPAEAFCLDVCETEDGWKIVEVNTLNSCGLYSANLTSLVTALEHAFN